MKKILSFLLFAITCILLVESVGFCIYGIYDINVYLNQLANTPGTSGIDYLGIGWEYGIGLFLLSVIGVIFSAISARISVFKIPKKLSSVAIVMFLILVMISVFIFYL